MAVLLEMVWAVFEQEGTFHVLSSEHIDQLEPDLEQPLIFGWAQPNPVTLTVWGLFGAAGLGCKSEQFSKGTTFWLEFVQYLNNVL